MGFLDRLFGRGGEPKRYRWKPLLCWSNDVIDLMRELERIDAPILNLEFEYGGQRYRCGMAAELADKPVGGRAFCNIIWFLDDREFDSLEEFLAKAEVAGTRFSELRLPLSLLSEEDTGDPRGYTLLAAREMSAEDMPPYPLREKEQ